MKKKISMWIEEDTIADIKKEAEDRGSKFANIANERMKQRADLTPPIVAAKVQTIINLSRAGKYDEAQEEENKLWKF